MLLAVATADTEFIDFPFLKTENHCAATNGRSIESQLACHTHLKVSFVIDNSLPQEMLEKMKNCKIPKSAL